MDVLIVENNPIVQKTIEMRLRQDGFRTHTVSDGNSALEMMEILKPHLVITDLIIPSLSGLELLYHIKNNSPSVKVIMLSTSKMSVQIQEAHNIGVDAVLSKPFNPSDLSKYAKRLVR